MCGEEPSIEFFMIHTRERKDNGFSSPDVAAFAVREARDVHEAADTMLSFPSSAGDGGTHGFAKRRRDEYSDELLEANNVQYRANEDCSEMSDDDSSSRLPLKSSAGTTRRRASREGASPSLLSASSALALFGFRGATSAAAPAPLQLQKQQPIRPPASFLQAVAPSPLTHVASRLAQMDARSYTDYDDENALSPAGTHGGASNEFGLPSTLTIASLPAVSDAFASVASSSSYIRSRNLRSYLSSDEIVGAWLPQLLTVMGGIETQNQQDGLPDAVDPATTASVTFIVRYLRAFRGLTMTRVFSYARHYSSLALFF